jgi:hypothetical protein
MDEGAGMPPAVESPPRLSISVLATTFEGTARALECVKRVTTDVDTQIVILVPAPKVVATEGRDGGLAQLVDRYRAAVVSAGIRATVLGCICRCLDDLVVQMVGPSGLVIVGGRRGLWWPTREERLIARLTARGYAAIFAQVGVLRNFSGTSWPAFRPGFLGW